MLAKVKQYRVWDEDAEETQEDTTATSFFEAIDQTIKQGSARRKHSDGRKKRTKKRRRSTSSGSQTSSSKSSTSEADMKCGFHWLFACRTRRERRSASPRLVARPRILRGNHE